MYRKIVVCVDDSMLSERVTRVGADLACRYNSDIVLLSVVDPASFSRQPYSGLEAVQLLDKHSRSLSTSVHRLGAMLHGMGVRNRQMMLAGRSVETILDVSKKEAADLIVIGAEARGRLRAWLSGDVWIGVSHKATCNVLRVTPADWIEDRKNSGEKPLIHAVPSVLTTSLSAL